jgi:hypothetical protein
MGRPRTSQTRTRPTTRRRTRAATTTAAAVEPAILAWEDDPGQPPVLRNPIGRPEPNLAHGSLPVKINGPAPAPAKYQPGTAEFRYWAAADALGRATEFWNGLLGGTRWEPSNGPTLPVELDEGVQFNAFYNRNGLHFFHGTTQNTTIYSGESPDVVCHELGHAVLDAVRPQLWDAMSAEVAGFHESFGDMSAILTALRLPQFATRVLTETQAQLGCTSRLSRLAEQLGWAIRQCRPDAVASDCLRNAANSFFYQPPEILPPQAPAAQLSSEPHSLSRVFTAAFLDILAGMLRLQSSADEAALATVATDAGTLLIQGVKTTPVVPTYLSQVAAHMIQVDHDRNGGRYLRPLANGFVRHGILSLHAAAAPPPPTEGLAPRAGAADDSLAPIALQGARFGLADELFVYAASQPKRFAVAGAAAELGEVDSVDHDRAATAFLEDLVRRGRVDFGDYATEALEAPDTRKTHVVVRERRRLVLRRQYFDCGFDCCVR